MAIVTPSARSYERVTGRWVRDFELQTPREWIVYYAKVIIGSPIPWLMWSYVVVAFLSRAGVEIAAWGAAVLTFAYIVADRMSSSREFKFFPVGGDIFLLGYVLIGALSALWGDSVGEGLANLGGVRWAILLYLLTYCWELFPGLNRVFALLLLSACCAGIYGIWQHFTGVDLIRGAALASAPVPKSIYFIPRGFFSTPEIFGTMMAMVAPFPIAAYMLADRKESRIKRYAALGAGLFLLLCVFWTYRPGLWMAAFAGVVVTVLMQARHFIGLILAFAAFVSLVLVATYDSADAMFDAVQVAEEARAERQRAQINTQVGLWQANPWIGVGRKAQDVATYDPGTGNVYFQVLAQSGVIGAGFYLLFILGFLLATYRIFQEIPGSHYWHRVLAAGALASQISFHLSGLFWSTLTESLAVNLFVLISSATCYLIEHYSRGLVTDDESL